MSRFDEKVAFVTGATSGIGRATALAFARKGASVVVADIAADSVEETARLIEQAGGQALAVTCDVSRSEDVRAALDAAVERFGHLDIAFNNAGIEQTIKPAHEITDDEWDRLVAVDLRGVFIAMKYEVEPEAPPTGSSATSTSTPSLRPPRPRPSPPRSFTSHPARAAPGRPTRTTRRSSSPTASASASAQAARSRRSAPATVSSSSPARTIRTALHRTASWCTSAGGPHEPDYDFSGQVALVTGAGAGMGLDTARAFAAAGAAVVLADVDEERAARPRPTS